MASKGRTLDPSSYPDALLLGEQAIFCLSLWLSMAEGDQGLENEPPSPWAQIYMSHTPHSLPPGLGYPAG